MPCSCHEPATFGHAPGCPFGAFQRPLPAVEEETARVSGMTIDGAWFDETAAFHQAGVIPGLDGHYVTATGRVLSDADIDALAEEANRGYCTAYRTAPAAGRCWRPLPCDEHFQEIENRR